MEEIYNNNFTEEENAMKVVEAVYVKHVKIYKCQATSTNDNDDDKAALLIMKVYDTNHYGEPGTNTDRIVQETIPKFESTWLSLEALCMEPSVLEPNLLDSLYATQAFLHDTSYVDIAKEVSSYLDSLFDFGPGTGGPVSPCRLVFVVGVDRLLATKDYLASRARYLDNFEKDQLNNNNNNNNNDNNNNEEGDTEMKYCYCANDNEFDDEEMEEDEEEEEDEEDDDFLDEVTGIAKSWLEIDEMSSLVEVKSSATVESMDVHCVTCKEMTCVRQGDDNDTECAICLSKFSGTKMHDNGYFKEASEAHAHEIMKLGCGHEFHHRCVFKWLTRKPSCPLCRTSSLVYVEMYKRLRI